MQGSHSDRIDIQPKLQLWCGWMGVKSPKLQLQKYNMCKIMQCVKLYNVQNYTMCKIMQGAKLCKEQNHAMCKFAHIA